MNYAVKDRVWSAPNFLVRPLGGYSISYQSTDDGKKRARRNPSPFQEALSYP